VLLLVLLLFEYFFEKGFGAVEDFQFVVFQFLYYRGFCLFLLFADFSPSTHFLQLVDLPLPLEHQLHLVVLQFILQHTEFLFTFPL
jgi:hypothetical protein